MKPQIKYTKGYKYQLEEDYEIQLGLEYCGNEDLVLDYITLTKNGKLIIFEGYAWDGPSGPTKDTKNAMRGSLIHDALYQLMRSGKLPHHYYMSADRIFFNCLKEDGMGAIRRGYWKLLKWTKGEAAKTKHKRKVYTAP